jgi:ribosomal-protein-alanine N-acetyltransferase
MVVIETERFRLREISEADVSERYLGWFRDNETRAYVAAAAGDLEDLRQYVRERVGRDSILFLGIFDKQNGLHVGNVKYEPVDSAKGYAIMGILIGDAAYRGQGTATEVLRASGQWLRDHRNIKQIALGVHRDNVAAIRAYERVGYRVGPSEYIPRTHPAAVTMVWAL